MSDNSSPWIVGQNSIKSLLHLFGSIRYYHHTGMYRFSNSHSSAMMDRNPAGTGNGIEQSIQNRPVGNGIGTIFHPFSFSIWCSHSTGHINIVRVTGKSHPSEGTFPFTKERSDISRHETGIIEGVG